MSELGNLEKIYKVKLQAQIISLIAGLIFFGMSILFLWLAFFTPGDDSQLFIIFTSGISLFAAVLGLVFIYKTFRFRKINLGLYENGLVLTDKNIIHTARWDDIESIYESVTQTIVNGLPTPPIHSFTVAKFNGDKFILEPVLKDVRQLGEKVKAEVFNRQLPIIIQRFYNGESIPFGKFSITQHFVSSADQAALPLPQFWKIVIKEGVVQIYSKENFKIWDSADYDSIPNVSIFLNLLEHHSKAVWSSRQRNFVE